MNPQPSTSTPSPLSPIHEKFDSSPHHIEGLRLRCEAMAKAIGFGEREIGEIGLCVNEAIANVIEHAYEFKEGKPIEFWAETIDGNKGIRIKVRDWGPGIDPSSLPVKPKDPLIPGGLGLICLREMMDAAEYARQADGGILLTLTKHLK